MNSRTNTHTPRGVARTWSLAVACGMLLLSGGLSAQALVQDMQFSQSFGTYTSIAGTGTQIITGNADDTESATQTLPFTFNHNGTDFTQFRAEANGSLRMGTLGPTTISTPISTTSCTNCIASGRDGRSGPLGVFYEVQGVAPNRVAVIDFPDWALSFTPNPNSNRQSFQIRLHETTNAVSFVYGAPQFGGTSYTLQVGMRGTSAANSFISRTTSTDWLATTASAASGNTCSWNSTVLPQDGLIFTFSQPYDCLISTENTFAEVTDVDCENNEFTVLVQSTDFDVNESLTFFFTTAGGLDLAVDATGTGFAVVPGLPADEVVFITAQNGPITCTVDLGIVQAGCPVLIDCDAEDYTETYCYQNNDSRTWLFQAPVGEQITINFSNGALADPGDGIYVYDGVDATGIPTGIFGFNATLTGLSATSTTGSLFMEILTNATGSCFTGEVSGAGFGFSVYCNAACTKPTGFVDPTQFVYDCDANTFSMNVQIELPGNLACSQIQYTVGGGAPTLAFGAPVFADGTPTGAPDTDCFGFFEGVIISGLPMDEPVEITLLYGPDNELGPVCDQPLGSFIVPSLLACFPNDPCTSQELPVGLNCVTVVADLNLDAAEPTDAGGTGGSPPYCNTAWGGVGFPNDPTCEAAICSADSFCCDVSWDTICANDAAVSPACTNCLSGGVPNIPNPSCGGFSAGTPDMWFSAVVPESGYLEIETFASGLEGAMTNTAMALYSGACEGPLTLLACDDNGGTGNFSLIAQGGLTPGTMVYLRLWSAFNGPGGTFAICFNTEPVCETPDPGPTTGPEGFCNGYPLSFGITNVVTGVQGLSYQWQFSLDNITYADILGATEPTADLTANGFTSGFWIQCLVSCSFSEDAIPSDPLFVPLNPAAECYCLASGNSTTFERISRVAFADFDNPSTSTAGYEDFTNIVGNVTTQYEYDLTVDLQPSDPSDFVYVFVDWNQDGDFDDAGELAYSSPATYGAPWTPVGPGDFTSITTSITIPATALPGNTRMRVKMSWLASPVPCGTTSFGQVEDYTLNITQCFGDNPTGVASNNGPVCSERDIELYLETDATAFHWTGPNGFESFEQNPVIPNATTAMSGVYTVEFDNGPGSCPGAASSTTVVVNQSPEPVISTVDYRICRDGSVPDGEGLTADAGVGGPGSLNAVFAPGNFPVDGTTFVTASTLVVPAVPPGATITGATLTLGSYQALGGSWRSEFRVELTGDYVSGELGPFSNLNSPGFITPDPVINLPGWPAGGGTVNLRLRDTFNDGGIDGILGSATITVNYITEVADVVWFDAETGGNLVAFGSPFDPVASGDVDNSVNGSTTFWAATIADGEPIITDMGVDIGGPFNVDGTSYQTLANFAVPAIPAGATLTDATLNFGYVALGGSWRSELRVDIIGDYVSGELGPFSNLNSAGVISPDPSVSLPGFPAAGGNMTLRARDTFNDSGIDGTMSNVVLVVTYAEEGGLGCTSLLRIPATFTVDGPIPNAGEDAVVYFTNGSNFNAYACTTLEATATEGTAPLSYQWVNLTSGEVAPAGATWNVCPQVLSTYEVTVTDANGCAYTDQVTVVAVDLACGNNDGKIQLCNWQSMQTMCVSPNGAQSVLDNNPNVTLGPCPKAEGIVGAELQVFPNPTRGDLVTITLDKVASDVQTINVDIMDFSGKRVIARTLPTQGGQVYQVIELNGELAAGMYMVNVTAGDDFFTKKLVIQP